MQSNDQIQTSAFVAEDGMNVFYRNWKSANEPKAIVVIAHGFNSHSGYYQWTAEQLTMQNFEVYGIDFPGRGSAHVLKLKNEDFSRNQEVVDYMNNDPLIANEVQPTKTVQQLSLADTRLKAEMSTIKLPLLILHGTADKATKPGGSQHFFDNASSQDKTLKFYEGHFHDLLNDIDKEIVMNDIIDWLNNRIN